MWLSDLAEKLGSVYIQAETLKAGLGRDGVGNSGSDYPYVPTGRDSDGTTLIDSRFIPGVSNEALFLGGAAVLGITALTVVLLND